MDVPAICPDHLLEMTVRKDTQFADIRADEYGYWQSRPSMNEWTPSKK